MGVWGNPGRDSPFSGNRVGGGSRMRGVFLKIGGQRWGAGGGRVSGRLMVPRGAGGIVENRK